MTRRISVVCLIVLSLFFIVNLVFAEGLQAIKLPQPQVQGGKPLMQALKERKSLRNFSSRQLPLQVIADLLWSAGGINRSGQAENRTAPSAMNMQEIDIYVAKAEGLYLFDAKENILKPVFSKDIRALTGKQDFVKDAPLNLIYVADLDKMKFHIESDINFYSAADTGFISENVYLYCASAGLATVVRGWMDKPALAEAMKLTKTQRVIFAQTVGYPKNDKP